MRVILIWIVLASLAVPPLFIGCAHNPDPPPKPQPETAAQRQARIDKAVKRGLDFLVDQQSDDGLWHKAGNYAIPISCIAGLALLHRANYADDPEPYIQAAYELTGEIVGHANQRSGQIFKKPSIHNFDSRHAFDQAFGVLFLTQVYQTDILSDAEQKIVHNIIAQAIGFIETHQDRSGCWYQNYSGGHNDIPTAMHIYALIAAKDAGFTVSKKVLDKAREFNKTYMKSGVALTLAASAVAAHIIGGWYQDPVLRTSVKSVIATCSQKESLDISAIDYANSYHLFTSTVCFYLGDKYWNDYYEGVSTWYLANQKESGAWPALRKGSMPPSEIYTTAMACLILQMPKRALPIYKNIDSARVRGKLQLEEQS